MKKSILFIVLFLCTLGAFAQEKKSGESDKKKTEEDPLKKVEASFDKAFDGLFKTKKKETSEAKPTEEKQKPETKEKDTGFGGFSFGGKPKEKYNFSA